MLKKTGIHLILTPFIIILLIHTILPTPPPPPQTETKETSQKTLIGIYFYLWYGNPDGTPGTRHWDNTPDTPVIGKYSSYNETVINWQIDKIQELNIDFLFLSWWGENTFEDHAIKKLLQVNNQRTNPINFTILIEPYTGDRLAIAQSRDPVNENPFNYTHAHQYIQKNFIDPYPNQYQNYHRKPLLVYFNPAQPPPDPRYEIHVTGDCSPDEPWEDWLWMLCDYGATSDNSTIHPPWFTSENQRAKNGYCSILPRFDDWLLYQNQFRNVWHRFDVNYTQGLYDRQWLFAIQEAHAGNIDIIGLFGWNEYQERTQIEPHNDPYQPDPYYIYEKTKHYIKMLRQTP